MIDGAQQIVVRYGRLESLPYRQRTNIALVGEGLDPPVRRQENHLPVPQLVLWDKFGFYNFKLLGATFVFQYADCRTKMIRMAVQ